MQKSLYSRIQKSKYHCDDFGRGKSRTAKKRHKRRLKKRVKQILKDIYKNIDL